MTDVDAANAGPDAEVSYEERFRLALHVLSGKPLAFRMTLHYPLGGDADDTLISHCRGISCTEPEPEPEWQSGDVVRLGGVYTRVLDRHGIWRDESGNKQASSRDFYDVYPDAWVIKNGKPVAAS